MTCGQSFMLNVVFGNLRYNKLLDRFTQRGRKKVNTQWQVYCMIHNIDKIAEA